MFGFRMFQTSNRSHTHTYDILYDIFFIYIHIIFNTLKGVIIGDVLSYSHYIPYWCCTSIIVNNAPLMLLYPFFSYDVNPNLPKASQSWFT